MTGLHIRPITLRLFCLSNPLPQNHLSRPKIPSTAYNSCSRFRRYRVYSNARPGEGKIKSGRAKDRDKTCRPAHGHYLLRLADEPTRERETIEQ